MIGNADEHITTSRAPKEDQEMYLFGYFAEFHLSWDPDISHPQWGLYVRGARGSGIS
jgi:hypothetical protein